MHLCSTEILVPISSSIREASFVVATVNAERFLHCDYGLLGPKLDNCNASKVQANAAEERVESM